MVTEAEIKKAYLDGWVDARIYENSYISWQSSKTKKRQDKRKRD